MSHNDPRSELYMGDDTEAEDVLAFVAERTENPAIFREGGVVVFNYHNESLVTHALSEWAAEADPGIYHVPYQVPGVWAFMSEALPERISFSGVLAYRQSDDAYVDYTNWKRRLIIGARFENGEAVADRLDDVHDAAGEVLYDA